MIITFVNFTYIRILQEIQNFAVFIYFGLKLTSIYVISHKWFHKHNME